MEKDSGKVTIRLPGGYAPEDGKLPGDRVRAVVEFELGENGQATVVSVDGAKYEAVSPSTPAAPAAVVAKEEVVVAPESADPFMDKLLS